jgi:hypothetical protein
MICEGGVMAFALLSGRLFIPALQSALPALRTKRLAAALGRMATPGSPPLFALRALVPSGLACVLARPPYGEAQTAIWAVRWAKLPDGGPAFFFSVERRAANIF